MLSKLFLLFAVFRLTIVYAYPAGNETKQIYISVHGSSKIDVGGNTSSVIYVAADGTRTNNFKHIVERKIWNHTLRIMILATQRLTNMDSWSAIPVTKNIQYFPILHIIRDNMILMQIYDIAGLAALYPKHKFLQVPIALSSFLDELEQSSDISLKFKSAYFMYGKHRIVEKYKMDWTNHYHTKNIIVNLHLTSNEYATKSDIHNWLRNFTKGRKPKKENLVSGELIDYQIIALQFTACWNIDIGPRKEVMHFQVPTLNDGGYIEHCVDAITSKEILGYHYNGRLEYRAIKIPYKNPNFSMVVILPNTITNLIEVFQNFTTSDYLELLAGVTNKKKRYIHYSIPALDIPMVKMNENGTWINSIESISCSLPLPEDYEWKPSIWREGFAQPITFFVNKPFGMMIFHEKTKSVLWQAWIRDPINKSYFPYKFLRHKNGTSGQMFEDSFIF